VSPLLFSSLQPTQKALLLSPDAAAYARPTSVFAAIEIIEQHQQLTINSFLFAYSLTKSTSAFPLLLSPFAKLGIMIVTNSNKDERVQVLFC
jgi:hypothetical protein